MPYVSQEQDLFRWRGTLQQIMIEQTDENLTKIEQSKKGLEEKLAYENTVFAVNALQFDPYHFEAS
eukprot:8496590-Pyramimonas_sp.AAC.1